MIENIKKNEEKLDRVLNILSALETAIDQLKEEENAIKEINAYYGSQEWFRDVEDFDSGKIERIKAGVLSEDAVWNMNERIKELTAELNEIAVNIFHDEK